MTCPNEDWQWRVRSLLREGFGVEDIALKLCCDTEHVRAEVRILRREGVLAEMWAR